MWRITNAGQHRATISFLACTLAESCWIRESFMIEDIIEIKAFYADTKSAKWYVLKEACTNLLTQWRVSDTIVVTAFAIIQVYSKHRTVKTKIKFCLFVIAFQMIHVKCITQEKPAPTYVWTNLQTRLGGKSEALSGFALYCICFICVCSLKHCRVIIMLRFYIAGIDVVKISEDPCKCPPYYMEYILLFFFTVYSNKLPLNISPVTCRFHGLMDTKCILCWSKAIGW